MIITTENAKQKNPKVYKLLKQTVFNSLSAINGRLNKNRFKNTESFCLFIGHGRSGHSIVGALLDAHPNIIISDEADTIGMMLHGFPRNKILSAIVLKSQWQAYRKRTKSGLGGKQYSYWVPRQWQGKHHNLRVLGDSKAGVTVDHLQKNPYALERLLSLLQLKLKVILVLNNSYDNIITMVLRGGRSLEKTTNNYFKKFETIIKISDQINPKDLIVVRHEQLIKHPKETLQKITNFLEMESSQNYLDACAEIIYESPNKTRNKIEWDKALINKVKENIDVIDYLTGYSYEN